MKILLIQYYEQRKGRTGTARPPHKSDAVKSRKPAARKDRRKGKSKKTFRRFLLYHIISRLSIEKRRIAPAPVYIRIFRRLNR